MTKLVKGQDNVIPVRVTSLIDYTGFSATLEIKGASKNISNLKSPEAKVVFLASEIASYGESTFGYMTIRDAQGEQHMKMMIQFKVVDSLSEALGFQTISVVIVSKFDYNWNGGGGGGDVPEDVVRKSDFIGIVPAKPTINSCQSTVNSILEAVNQE